MYILSSERDFKRRKTNHLKNRMRDAPIGVKYPWEEYGICFVGPILVYTYLHPSPPLFVRSFGNYTASYDIYAHVWLITPDNRVLYRAQTHTYSWE